MQRNGSSNPLSSAVFRSKRRADPWAILIIAACIGVATPALALSLKSIMGEMGDTTKQTKRLLAGPFEATEAQAILADYAQQASASEALFAGRSDAKAQDLRQRLHRLAASAQAAQSSVSDRASFRRAFGGLVEECRSCHAIYK
jgi:cytochrome c556